MSGVAPGAAPSYWRRPKPSTSRETPNANLSYTIVSGPDSAKGTLSTTSTNGVYSFDSALDFFGQASFTYKVTDRGDPDNCQAASPQPAQGCDAPETSAQKTVTVTVNPVNDEPVANDDLNAGTTPEDTPITIQPATLLGNDSVGPANENGQELHITQVFNPPDGNGIGHGTAVLNPDESVTFTPDPDYNGLASFDYTVCDTGGTANGGENCFQGTAVVKVTVSAVNDAPSFTAGGNQQVDEDSGAQSVPNWATDISAGPADESGQTVGFVVTSNSNTGLFSAGPAVSANGTLTYTPKVNANGSATIKVVAKDSGGTANGGVDTSAEQTFTITVNSVNDAPNITAVTGGPANEGSPATIKVTANDGNDVPSNTLSYWFDCNNDDNFEIGPQPSNEAQCTFADEGEGPYPVNVRVTDDGGTANGGDDSTDESTDVVVNNVAPSIGALNFNGTNSGTACISSGKTVTLSFSITDPGSTDSISGTIDWGDLSTPTSFTGRSVSVSHTYPSGAGTYKVNVLANDGDGGIDNTASDNTGGSVSLLYNVSELQDPVNRTGMTMSVFKSGSVIPLKVLITDCNNQPVNGLVPKISFTRINPATPVVSPNEAVSIQPNDTNFLMRDAGNGQYIYNLSTKSLPDPDATYNATITDSKATQTAPATYGPKVTQNFGVRSK